MRPARSFAASYFAHAMRVARFFLIFLFLALASRTVQAQAQPQPKAPPPPEEEAVQVRVALPTVVGVASDYVGALFSKQKRQNLFDQKKRSRTSNPVLILNVPTTPSRWLERNFGRDTP